VIRLTPDATNGRALSAGLWIGALIPLTQRAESEFRAPAFVWADEKEVILEGL
jgi:hypothetical protein